MKVINLTSAGYDGLKTEYITARGIRVGTAGRATTNSTAEMAVTLLLAASRNLIPILNVYKR